MAKPKKSSNPIEEFIRVKDNDQIADFLTPFLKEIRRRLFFTIASFVFGGVVGLIYHKKIINLALSTFEIAGVNIVFTSAFEFINLAFSAALLTGVVATLPILFYQILSFLKPALSKKEFSMLKSLVPATFFLFIFGFFYGYSMMRYVLTIFYQQSLDLDVGNYLDISQLLSQILVTSTLMGLAFEFPIILTVIMRLNIVSYNKIAGQRMIAFAASLIFAAFLPPTDVISLLLLTMPLVILFELTLIFNRSLRTTARPPNSGQK